MKLNEKSGPKISSIHILCQVLIGLLFALVITKVHADATVTTVATGGGAISADTTGGTFTNLTAPVINETNAAGLSIGSYTISVPAGFEFNTGANSVTISIGVSSGSTATNRQINLGAGRGVSVNVTPTASTISFSVTQESSGNTRNTLTFSGISVRPTAPGCPLSTGNITVAGATTFTNNIVGSLTEIAGAAARMVTVLPGESYDSASCSVTGTASDQGVNVPFDISQLVVTDQFGNIQTGFNNTNVTIIYSYSGPGTPSFANPVDFSAGLSTTTLTTTLDTAATAVTITATTGSLTGIPSSSFDVIAGLLPADHYSISYPNGATGTACVLPVVEITAHANDESNVDIAVGTVLNFSTSTGQGIWGNSLLAGTGTWNPSGLDDGVASYTWPGGESSFQVELSHSTATVNIDLDDGTVTDTGDGGVEDPDLMFSADPVIRISSDGTTASSIGTEIAGKDSDQAPAQTLYIQLKQSGVTTGGRDGCETPGEYSGVNSVAVALECINPATCSGQQASVNGVTVNTSHHYNFGTVPSPLVGTGINFNFDGTGTAMDDNKALLTFNYPDAGQVILHFEVSMDPPGGNNPPRTFSGFSNAFVVRPFGFDVQVSGNPAATGPGGSSFIQAGSNFTVTVRAVQWESTDDDGTPSGTANDGIPDGHEDTDPSNNVDLSNNSVTPGYGQEGTDELTDEDIVISAILDQPTGGNDPGLGGDISITNISTGAGNSSTVHYDETGIIEVLALVEDGDYLGIGSAETTNIRGQSGYVGRFYPDHFTLAPGPVITNRSTMSPACSPASNFTYMDEVFNINFTLLAENALATPTTTENYTGAFAFLPINIGSMNFGAIDLTAPTPLTARLMVVSVTGNWSNGVAVISSDMGVDRAVTEDGPYDQFNVGIIPVDTDGVTMDVLNIDADDNGSNDHTTLGSTVIRFGRLVIGTAFGSELLPVSVPFQAEFFNGTTFQVNSDDSCTFIDDLDTNTVPDLVLSNDIQLNQVDGDIQICAAGGTSTLTLADNPFTAGLGNLSFSAPLLACVGYSDMTLDLTNLGLGWLQYDWDGDSNFDDDPSGRATFGIFKGSKEFIYTREPWN